MKIFQSLLKKAKKVASVAAILAVLATGFTPATKALATGQEFTPKFNFMDNDPRLIRGSNLTKNATDWTNPVSGDAGDEFRGLVYVHNGIVDSTARNTRVKVTIPERTSGKTAQIGATLSSDNSEPRSISDTLTVNMSEDTDIEFIPGSVKWFPVQNGSADTAVPFPAGQSGNEIVGPNGVNIGDVKGCWEFVSYISFGFRTKAKGVPTFDIEKLVRNVTKNESGFVKSNFADPNDILEYQVSFRNKGTATSTVTLIDSIPVHTSYQAGTTSFSKNGGAFQGVNDGIVGSGLVIDNMNPGDSVVVKFQVKVSPSAPAGECLINTATLFFGKTSIFDTAKTTIKQGVVPVTPAPVTPTEKPLPQSGPLASASLFGSLLGLLGYGIVRYKKTVNSETNLIVEDLLK